MWLSPQACKCVFERVLLVFHSFTASSVIFHSWPAGATPYSQESTYLFSFKRTINLSQLTDKVEELDMSVTTNFHQSKQKCVPLHRKIKVTVSHMFINHDGV